MVSRKVSKEGNQQSARSNIADGLSDALKRMS